MAFEIWKSVQKFGRSQGGGPFGPPPAGRVTIQTPAGRGLIYFTVWKKQTNLTEYTYICQISTEKQTTNRRIFRSPILAHLAYSWHTLGSLLAHSWLILGSLWAHLARMAHLAHSWLTHGSLDSHGSLLAHSADLADLTDLAHSCLTLGSLRFTWLTLGSP